MGKTDARKGGITLSTSRAIGIERVDLAVAIAEVNDVTLPIGRVTDDRR